MKSENSSSTDRFQTQSSSVSISRIISEQAENSIPVIKCPSSNQAFEYCLNPSCQQQVIFLCSERKCKCRQIHRKCSKTDIDYTLGIIKQKILDTKNIKEFVQEEIQKLIDELSKLRDCLMKKIDEEICFTTLHKQQKSFLQMINGICPNKLSSKQASTLWDIINTSYAPQFDILQNIKTLMISFTGEVLLQSELLKTSINQLVLDQKLLEVVSSEIIQNHLTEFRAKSSILSTNQEVEKLAKFFDKHIISSVQLLYKASQNDFLMSKYYQKCGSVPNTLILCLSGKDKILGAYTPLTFMPQQNQINYIQDPSQSSFIFSLTENDKFTLRTKQKAIYRFATKNCLSFGNAEFKIYNKANDDDQCESYLSNRCYVNDKYKNDRESYLKLNGYESQEFSAKEWEVWKLSLEEKKSSDKK